MRYDTYRPSYRRPQKKSKRWLIVPLLLIAAAAGFWLLRSGKAPVNVPLISQNNDTKKELQYESVNGKYLFSGTVVIARAVENEARQADGSIDYNQPFSKFSSFNPEQYDAWEFDHECPMTTNNIPYRQQVANTVFNCRPEFVPAMRRQFGTIVANIANNHTRDMGEEGYEETVRLLEEGGIQTLGNYSPRVKDDICEVVAWPVRLQKKDKTEVKGKLPIAFCAWHYFEYDPEPGEIEVMDRYVRVMPVFAFMQVGTEYQPRADDKQVRIAHRIIDRGPEFLIGNSPHWVQNTEVYKGKLIVYSTGNFIFDQLDYETNRGLSIAVTMTLPYDENVAKWLEFGDQCRPRNDSCLEMAEEQGLEKIKPKLEYEAIGSSGGYRQLTQRANADLQRAIEERANWQQSMNQLWH
jgi:hypothetical protein